jgi:tetratricopeptide (TPR) repeat protein
LIVVEGLGRDFSGDDAEYPGFTPFLDSLSNQSLTWTNFMSNAGRSFGALPSILGSLPFGKNGFLDMENLPDHLSLISQLKKSNYKTSYFEGGDADFDHKLKYLDSEGMENIVDDNSYSSEYTKTPSNEGFSWGYPDSEIFRKTLSELKPLAQPRFDMILTISNHEPFIFNGKEKYLAKVDYMLGKSTWSDRKKETLIKYKDIFSALLYTDHSIKEFMEKYKSSPNYENTIFIITGDHRLIPVPQKDEICRFHVPLIIYSPMLTKPEKLKGICSHMDIMPSILALINHKYGEKSPSNVPWIGTGLSDASTFINNHDIPLTRYKGAIKDFVSGNMFLSDKVLFSIDEKFSITEEIDSDKYDKIHQKISQFQKTNNYVTQNNKIIPANLAIKKTNAKVFTKEQQQIINKHIEGRIDEDLFMIAREVAFKKQYKDALLLCDYVIKDSPNHFDARTLKGRIYAWNGEYQKAEEELTTILERGPRYQDAYNAMLDMYWWSDQQKKAQDLVKKAKVNIGEDVEFQKNIKIAMKRFDKSSI